MTGMTPPGRRVSDSDNLAALQPQIDMLGEKVDRGFGELKEMLRSFDERLRKTEQAQAGCQPLVEMKVNAAWKKLDEHDEAITNMTKSVDKLSEIGKWLLGIITAMIISFLIALVTGRVDLLIK